VDKPDPGAPGKAFGWSVVFKGNGSSIHGDVMEHDKIYDNGKEHEKKLFVSVEARP